MIDAIIQSLQHPAFMMFGGLLFYFSIKWSIMRNKDPNKRFFEDQKDEIIVSLIGGLLFVVFDDEMLLGYDYMMVSMNMHDHDVPPTELNSFMYLLVGPAVERIYKMFGG